MSQNDRIYKKYDVIIIGAGAAGMMCAIEAGKRGRKVLLIEKAKKPGEKIRISGGGRCNFTNIHISEKNFISKNPHFCVSALRRYGSQDFINLVKKHKISYHEKTLGQLFCDFSSQQIIDMLLTECKDGCVEIMLNSEVKTIEKKQNFILEIVNIINNKSQQKNPQKLDLAGLDDDINAMQENKIEKFLCDSLVIATGGLSIPKMGATSFGYDVARQFGINIIDPYPALVPLTLDSELLKETQKLSGISLEAIVSCNYELANNSKKIITFREAILFTHRGLSGPAILQISSYLKKGGEILINMVPEHDMYQIFIAQKKQNPKQDITTIINNFLPKNLSLYIVQTLINQWMKVDSKINLSKQIADLSNQKLKQVADSINSWRLVPSGCEGYTKAEVTGFGIDTNEISSKTFETKSVLGLYFIGEVLDVTGHLGGFNFQFSWSSGYNAGQYV